MTVKLDFAEVSRHFAPGWFAAVMGTGALALTSLHFSQTIPFLSPFAWGLHYFNFAFFVLLALPWLTRWLAHPDAVQQTLRHPVQAHFYPTFSIALLILAAQCNAFSMSVNLALTLWWSGTLLTYGFSFLVLYHVFRGEQVGMDHVTPGMYIPPVGLVVIPMAGAPLLPFQVDAVRELALLFNYLGLGAGIGMYVSFLALNLFRFVLHKPVQGMLTPTLWIQLAPVGVIIVSLLNLVEQTPLIVNRDVFHVLALLLWGFGFWWLVMCLLLTSAVKRGGQLPFALSWWAFTFPLGAFVAAGIRLSVVMQIGLLHAVSLAAYVLLVVFWSITFYKTLRGALSGQLFKAH